MPALAIAGAAGTLAAQAEPAAAHTDITSTSPRRGAVLAEAPRRVTVTYGFPLAAVDSAAIESPGGAASAGPPRLRRTDARAVVIPLRGGRPWGPVRVEWTVIGADGHELAGELRFVVEPPGLVAGIREMAALLRRVAARVDAASAGLTA